MHNFLGLIKKMEDLILLPGLRFPRDCSTLTRLLNKYRFRGHRNWTYNPDGVEVFSPSEKTKHLSGDFFARLLFLYLECLQRLEECKQKFAGSDYPQPELVVTEEYAFRLNHSDDSADGFIVLEPMIMQLYLQTYLQQEN